MMIRPIHLSRHRRSGKTLVIILLVLVILAAAGWTARGWFSGPGAPPGGGRDIAEPFLSQLRDGQASAAWDSTTAEFKSAMGRETFLGYVKKNPVLKQPSEFISVQQVSVNDLPRTECVYRVPSPEKGKGTVRVLLASEQGKWKVERLNVE